MHGCHFWHTRYRLTRYSLVVWPGVYAMFLSRNQISAKFIQHHLFLSVDQCVSTTQPRPTVTAVEMGQPSSSSVSSTTLQPARATLLPKAMTGKQNKNCIGTCTMVSMVY